MINVNSLWNIPWLGHGNLATCYTADVVADYNTLLFKVLDWRRCHVKISNFLVCGYLGLRINIICNLILSGGPSLMNLHLPTATWLLLTLSLYDHRLLDLSR